MGKIRNLDRNMINMIAAGEVIERPASVVKELMENSIDAGATKIVVSVEDGGRRLISSTDNGKGMDAEDLARAFDPHTTSKIRESSDLKAILTLGFTGEALAAAVIMATGYDDSEPLVCPMCGSGTLAIEAALIASKRAPGLLRSNYGFMHTEYFDEPPWKQMRSEALKKSKQRGGKTGFKPARIIATDIDANAVEAASKNAMTAGVSHLIDFDACDFAETSVPPGAGIIIMNPEYGLRLGDIKKLKKTYKRIGDFFKQKCPGFTGYIFTGNPALSKSVGLRTSRRIEFYNANIECRLLKYELYAGTRNKE